MGKKNRKVVKKEASSAASSSTASSGAASSAAASIEKTIAALTDEKRKKNEADFVARLHDEKAGALDESLEKNLVDAVATLNAKEFVKLLTQHKEKIPVSALGAILRRLTLKIFEVPLRNNQKPSHEDICSAALDFTLTKAVLPTSQEANLQSLMIRTLIQYICIFPYKKIVKRMQQSDVPIMELISAAVCVGPHSLAVSRYLGLSNNKKTLEQLEERQKNAREQLMVVLKQKLSEVTVTNLYWGFHQFAVFSQEYHIDDVEIKALLAAAVNQKNISDLYMEAVKFQVQGSDLIISLTSALASPVLLQNLLLNAAGNNNLIVAQALLKLNVNLDAEDTSHEAVMLTQMSPNSSVKIANKIAFSMTPLHNAIMAGHNHLAQLLVLKGANIEAPLTPLRNQNHTNDVATPEAQRYQEQKMAERFDARWQLGLLDCTGMAIKMETQPASTRTLNDIYNYNATMIAIARHRNDLVGFLLTNGANKDARTIYGESLLIVAAIKNNIAATQLLLEAGVYLHFKDFRANRTARQWAQHHHHDEVAKILLIAELKEWLKTFLVKKDNDAEILKLAEVLASLQAEISADRQKVTITSTHLKLKDIDFSLVPTICLNIGNCQEVVAGFNQPENQKTYAQLIWDQAPVNRLKRTFAELLESQKLCQTILMQTKTFNEDITDDVNYLAKEIDLPERRKISVAELTRKDELVKKLNQYQEEFSTLQQRYLPVFTLGPTDDHLNARAKEITDLHAELQKLHVFIRSYADSLALLQRAIKKKADKLFHSKHQTASAAEIATRHIQDRLSEVPVAEGAAQPQVKIKLPRPQRPRVQAVRETPKKITEKEAKAQPAYIVYGKRRKPTQRTFGNVTDIIKKMQLEEELNSLRTVLKYAFDENNMTDLLVEKNALLGICARIFAKKDLWDERCVLFHHPAFSTPRSSLAEQIKFNALLRSMAIHLFDNTEKSFLMLDVQSKCKKNPQKTLALCLNQLALARQEWQLHSGINPNLFPTEVLLGAKGFIAARLSTYVIPVLKKKKQLATLHGLPEWPQLNELIDFAKPYIGWGGDFRHGKPYSGFLQAGESLFAASASGDVKESEREQGPQFEIFEGPAPAKAAAAAPRGP